MKQLYKIYQDAPPLGKILMIAAAIFLAYILYRVITRLAEPKPTNENQIDSAEDEVKQLAQSGQVTHYTTSQMAGFADKLYKAMDGQGTDEEQIGAVFNYMQNKADVLQLIKAFGIREYEDPFFVSYDYNLTQWLNEELDEDEIEEYINAPLRAKGINYKF